MFIKSMPSQVEKARHRRRQFSQVLHNVAHVHLPINLLFAIQALFRPWLGRWGQLAHPG